MNSTELTTAELIEWLDGEAVVVDEDGKFCFSHGIYMNGICVECGTELDLSQT